MKRLMIAAKVKAGLVVLCTLIVLAPLVDAQAAQIIGSWVAGTSHTEEPGTNRALIFTAHAESSTADADLATVTYGGQSMTKVVDWIYTTTFSEYVAAFILDEAGIAAATDSNFVVTWGTASSEIPAYTSVFLSDVNQSTPVGDTGTGGSATTTAATPALSTNDGDMAIVAACNGNTGTYSTINGFTEAIELTMTSSDGIAGYLAATGAAVTPGVSHTNVNRQAVIGLVVQSGCAGDGDCDDGNVCTDDVCVGGVCQNTNNAAACDDGLYCNGADTCGGGTCSVHAGDPCPDDGLYCTGTESCDEVGDQCLSSGDPCPGTECNTCQESTDSCFDTTGTTCTDDGNVCTDDQCNGAGSCTHPNNTASCDDLIACTESDTCSGGACNGTPNNTLCPDGNICTDDICTVGVGCSNPNNTASCDDGLYCNGTDTCGAGSCSVHTGNPCPETECNTCQEATDSCFDTAGTTCTDDGNVCTDDQCNGAGTCAHPNNTDPCDDTVFCNGADTCSGGTCSVHAGDPCTDDSLYCTGTEYCDEPLDTCTNTGDPCTPLVCDDGTDTCTGSTASLILLDAYGTPGTISISLDNLEDEVSEVRFDLCDPEQHPWLTIPTGACTLTGRVPQGAGASCQITDPVPADGCLSLEILAETGNFISLGTGPIAEVGYTLTPVPPPGEFADLVFENIDVLDDLAASVDVTPQAGKVGASCQNDGDCEDNNSCTTDTCNGGVCEYANVTGACDDGLYCTDSDTCVSGVCTGTARDCDDGLYCTGTESCDEGSDQCLSSGDPCPGTECNTCQEATDSCFDTAGTTCTDDGNVCTDDQCNGAGACGHPNNTNPCDDLIACTESDTCSGGACNGTPNNSLCSDGNICTDDICTVGVGCSNPNNTAPCDDTLFCNGTDTCGGGSCSVHLGNPCPETECNTCQEATDSCFDTAGTSCTDDGNVCTDDQCNGAGTCAHPNNTASCDDLIACTESDTCSGGACNGTPNNSLCSDGNICTDDICTVGVGCSNPNNTAPCDDALFCNGTDTCGGGSCSVHAGSPCPETECNTCQEATDSCFDTAGTSCTDDGNVCTDDTCDGAGTCAHPNNTASCDDLIACTESDTCSGGACNGTPNNSLCSDANSCTDDICTAGVGCSNPNNTDPCDDTVFCNGTDTCSGGTCSVHAGDPCADDSLYCTGTEYCDEPLDTCTNTGDPCTPLVCDDGTDTCTGSTASLILLDAYGTPGTISISLDNLEDEVSEVRFDLCDPEQHPWLTIPTGACTLTGRVPQGAGASCQITDPVPADGCLSLEILAETGNFISLGTGPIAEVGYTLTPVPPPGEFADLVFENIDVLDDLAASVDVTPQAGKVGASCQNDGDCEDNNSCTTDTCNGGVCEYANVTGACDDGLYCTDSDTCVSGVCTGTARDCDDGLYCTGTESCDEGSDQCLSSGDPCPGTECNTCQEATDSCFDTAGTTCTDDGNVCTDDQCNGAGACGHPNNTNPCDDLIACTESDTCSGGACNGTPNNSLCSDGNICTDDICTVGVGCSNPNNTAPCDDTLFCNGTDTCGGGSCSVHLGNPCPETECNTCQEATDSCFDTAGTSCTDDGNVCTDDQCNGAGTCAHPNNTASCDDLIACTESDTCSGGACNGTPSNSLCSDGNICTDDICTVGVGCSNPNNTAPCDDALFCNGTDTCGGGSCSVHAGSPCPETECNTCQEATDSCFDTAGTSCTDDGNVCTDDTCDGAGTCAHPNNTDPCDDGLYCTQTDECQGGLCRGSDDPCIDNGNFCDGVEFCQEDISNYMCSSTNSVTDPCSPLFCNDLTDECQGSDVDIIISDVYGYVGTIDIELQNDFDSVSAFQVNICDADNRAWLHIDTGSCSTTPRSIDFTCGITDIGGGCVRVTLSTVSGLIIPGTGAIARVGYSFDAEAPTIDLTDLIPENAIVLDDISASLAVTPVPGIARAVECMVDGDCDDGNLCTDDSCSGNICQFANNTLVCDDAIVCTENDACSGGVCSGTPNNTLCADADVCTDDVCTVGIGCSNPDNTAPCDDSVPCTENDTCSGGTCNGTPNNSLCSDANVCTDDVCTVGIGCSNPNNTAPCDDVIPCTETDVCSGGTCNGTPNNSLCSDANVCTDDVCTVGIGCSNPDNTAPCDDVIPCTETDVCSGGTCNGTPNNSLCSDANVCTDDICTVGVGCSNPNNTAPCDDAIPCTETDVCSGGTCSGTPNNTLCSDANVCTDDVCTIGVGCSNPDNILPCDDGLFCNGNDTCSAGTCSSHAGNPCPETECNTCQEATDSCFDVAGTACTDDLNVCTDDTCDGGGTCAHPNNTASCDDGLYCNGTDTCSGGACIVHAGSPCPETECNTCQEASDTCFDTSGTACTDDGNVCTDDTCDGTGACTHPDNTDPCDDGLFCTQIDECQSGLCIGRDDPCADNNTYCDGVEYCQEDVSSFICNSTGDPCDVALTCDEASDVCDVSDVTVIVADAYGYAGNIDIELDNFLDAVGEVHVDICDRDQRSWLTISPASCSTTARSSAFTCAVTNLGGGCVGVDITSSVSGLILTGTGAIAQLSYTIDPSTPPGDYADVTPDNSDIRDDGAVLLAVTPKSGRVGTLECIDAGDCDDLNVCTDDACVGNVCQYINNVNPCDDGLYCNGTDTCRAGTCLDHTGSPCPETECNTCQEATDSCFDPGGTLCTDDGNECTDDTCDGTGACTHPNNTAPCDDSIFCNGADTCSGGACTVHAGTPCPETECNTCQEATDSCFDPSGTVCTDDGNVCTDDTCDGAGACAHPNNTASCDDTLFCNGTDTCSGGSCSVHAGSPCPETECNTCQEATDSCFDPGGTLCTDDGNECTDDTCDGGGACAHPNNTAPCDDSIFCNGTDTCSGGSCSIHTGSPCPETECNTCQEATDSCFDPGGTLCTDDGNVCTDDTCDGTGACAHPNNTASCDDTLFCNGTDTCSGGNCSVHAGNPCPETECNTCQEATDSCFDPGGTLCTDDGNVCTDDTCDGGGSCAHPLNSAPTVTLFPDPLSLGNPGAYGVITALIEESSVPVEGEAVTFWESADPDSAIELSPLVELDINGEAVVTIHGLQAGSGTLNVKAVDANGDEILAVTYILGNPVDSGCATLGGTTLNISGSAPCDTEMTVTCEDSLGDPLMGYLIAKIDPPSAAVTVEVVPITDSAGEARVLVEAAAEGQATVSASVTCGVSSGQATVDVLQSEWHMSLTAGWNWIGYVVSEVKYRGASYPGGNPLVPFATPPDPSLFIPVNSINDILSSIDGQYDVVRSFDINGGHTYDPTVPDFINTLDYMGPGYGYQIKMSVDAELVLVGSILPTTATMPVTVGWNWVAYWLNSVGYREASYPGGNPAVSFATPPDPTVHTSVVSVSDILTSIDGQYDVARSFDINGGHTYDPVVPDFINTLDYMGPGYGYQIKMASGGVLDWSASGIFTSSMMQQEPQRVFYPASPGDSHFTPVAQTATWMDLWGTFTLDGISAELGDEVGVFVNDDCFGAYAVDDPPGWYGFLPVYGNDPVTPGKDGADPGDLLTIKIWDSSAGVAYTLSTDEYTGPDPLTWTNGATERVNIAAILGVGECVVDEDCDLCSKCEAGMCLFQMDSEDIKEECPDQACTTGFCDGAGTCGFEPATTECRASAGACDIAESCTGSSAVCPSDAYEPDGTTCDDGLYCTQADECQAGQCRGRDDPCVDNGEYCDGVEFCDEGTGSCYSTNDPCAPFDLNCDEVNDVCEESVVTLLIADAYGYSGTIDIELENDFDLVSEVQLDVCDVDQPPWLQIDMTDCSTTTRSSDFICSISDLGNGCARVAITTSVLGVIEPGTGAFAQLHYSLDATAPPGEYADINPENIAIQDDAQEFLPVTSRPGQVGTEVAIGECESDFDCDEDVDAADLETFMDDFGRNQYSNPCITENPCLGDLDCDRDVDGDDVTNFLEDFGRNQYSNPCPACSPQPPCY